MSDHDRRLKDGENQNKQNQQMREHQSSGHVPGTTQGQTQSPAEQLAQQPREPFDADLRPHPFEGGNWGLETEHNVDRMIRAYDMKQLHDRFPQLQNDELKSILILPAGTRLEQGATYLDLNRLEAGEFTARSDMHSEEGMLLVPKQHLDYELWNKLLGRETANT